jgi:enamine deaminase RidA (YjgF/YER057c/UK114 family)
MGIELPAVAPPVAAYVPAVRTGSLVYVSGQVPLIDGKVAATGTVPGAVSAERAKELAARCAVQGLAAVRAEVGELSRIRRVVRIGVFVASEAGFGGQPEVANGASELLVSVLGERGRHARAAVGCPALPRNVPVEVEFLFEVE